MLEVVMSEVSTVSQFWHSPDPSQPSSPYPDSSVSAQCSVYTIAAHSFEILSLANIRACVSWPGDCIDSSHWVPGRGVDINWVAVIGHWLLSGLTIPITTQYKSNACRILFNKSSSHVFNEVHLRVNIHFIFYNIESYCARPTLTPPRKWQMLKTTQSISPSSYLMIHVTNIILYLSLVARLRLHNWVMQNKMYPQSQHYVPWWNVTPLTFKWLERLTDKMLLPLTGDGEGEM